VEEILITEAELSDCADIARLINESAEGAVDYLFGNVSQDATSAEQIMSNLLTREVHYSYANTVVAKLAGEVVGMALSFPANGLIHNEPMRQYYSAAQFQYIQYFVDNKLKDSWHLDAICVDSEFRGGGMGRKLLDAVKQQAQYYKFPTLEVFVFASNTGAIRFYQCNGFVTYDEIETINHEFLGDKSPLILMRCDLPVRA